MNKFQLTKLKDLINKTDIIYENGDNLTLIDEDIEFIKTYYEFNKLFEVGNTNNECMSKWILRMEFDKEAMLDRNITMIDIQEKLYLIHKVNDNSMSL